MCYRDNILATGFVAISVYLNHAQSCVVNADFQWRSDIYIKSLLSGRVETLLPISTYILVSQPKFHIKST